MRSYLCEWGVPILAPPSIFTSKRVVTIMAAYWLILPLSVSEKLVYHFRFLAALLPWLASPHTLHGSVCFVDCKRSDPSVLVAGKWHNRTEILLNTGTYSATFTVVILHKAGKILLLLPELPASIHWFDVNASVNHTYQEPPLQI